jgi:hypothetical protein
LVYRDQLFGKTLGGTTAAVIIGKIADFWALFTQAIARTGDLSIQRIAAGSASLILCAIELGGEVCVGGDFRDTRGKATPFDISR